MKHWELTAQLARELQLAAIEAKDEAEEARYDAEEARETAERARETAEALAREAEQARVLHVCTEAERVRAEAAQRQEQAADEDAMDASHAETGAQDRAEARRLELEEIYEAGLRAIERGERPESVLPTHMQPSPAFLAAMDACDKMERAETRRRLEADAVRQWGASHESRAPPKVYSLTGDPKQ